ncbi:MAG: hypothetical protein Q9191_003546 [Dirinaria sp. TL-2023a]
MATRAFSNLFETAAGRELADKSYSKIHNLVQQSAAESATASSPSSSNRALSIAIATLYVNYAVLFTQQKSFSSASIERGLELVHDLTSMIRQNSDAEAVYRALVALGTLLTLGDEVIKRAADEICDAEGALRKAEQSVREPRVKGVIAEIRALLKG